MEKNTNFIDYLSKKIPTLKINFNVLRFSILKILTEYDVYYLAIKNIGRTSYEYF